MRLAPMFVAVALLSACASGDKRYLSSPREQRIPPAVRTAAHAFFPWDRRGGENALRAGPVYLLALSYRSQISRDGDDSDGAGNDLHRALVAVAPSYSKPITLSGRGLAFSTDGATHCAVRGLVVHCRPRLFREARALHVAAGRRWRIVRTMLVLPRAGRFRIVASGPGLRAVISLTSPS